VVRGKRKKCVAGAGLSSVGRAAFLHNVIIGQCTLSFWKTYFFYCPIMPHYVKKLWEKFLLPSIIFFRRDTFVGIQKLLSVGKWWGTED